MAASDTYTELVGRLGKWILLLGALGALGVAVRWGVRDAAGFAIGALGAFLNMRWLANGLLAPSGPAAGLLILRFGVLAGASYAILKTFGISPLSLLSGLLTASAAVVLEVLYQLFYART
ncbi:MAG: hypothetical protein FJW30_15875 [Acidobacteria bacterium]|nr:hypothetical protein [Acidobacteriota bacterium]